MTLRALLSKTTLPPLDAEVLFTFISGKTREHILANLDAPVRSSQKVRFNRLAKKRAAGTPLAYLTGTKAFFGLDFFVNKHTLIPRPETEQMVELAMNNEQLIEDVTLLDVGTGSGCIPISIATLKPNWLLLASDISSKALKVAKKNATAHGVSVEFAQGNLLEPFVNRSFEHLIITANLPYLNDEEMAEPSIQAEPKRALYGGKDGLDLYRKLIEQMKQLQAKTLTAFFEINPQQSTRLQAEIETRFADAEILVHDDLCNRARIIEMRT